jgi:hypothetical protein
MYRSRLILILAAAGPLTAAATLTTTGGDPRVSMLVDGPSNDADPARAFRSYFDIMKNYAAEFRKTIGVQ